MLKVRGQGGVRNEVLRLCHQVLPVLFLYFLAHLMSTQWINPLRPSAPLHLWSSVLSQECFRKKGDLRSLHMIDLSFLNRAMQALRKFYFIFLHVPWFFNRQSLNQVFKNESIMIFLIIKLNLVHCRNLGNMKRVDTKIQINHYFPMQKYTY